MRIALSIASVALCMVLQHMMTKSAPARSRPCAAAAMRRLPSSQPPGRCRTEMFGEVEGVQDRFRGGNAALPVLHFAVEEAVVDG